MSVPEKDAVRRFLEQRGCPDDVVEGGLDGLVDEWERVVTHVEEGYPLGFDDYLNDMDGRQLIEEALPLAAEPDREAAALRVRAADERIRRCVKTVSKCLWGERVAQAEGWTPFENWWYFVLPNSPGPLLRDDLKGSR